MQLAHWKTIRTLLVAALASAGVGCGSIDLPITLALEGDNSISLDVPPLSMDGTPDVETELVGGVEMTMSASLTDLFSPHGLLAMITVDDVRIAGPAVLFLGFLDTGTLCVSEVPDSGGGTAHLRPFQGQADIQVTLDTVVWPLALLPVLPDGFPFSADIDDTVPLSFSDLIGFALGGTGNLTVSQELETVLDAPDLFGGILDGTVIAANLTLSSAEAIPSDPLLDECATAGF